MRVCDNVGGREEEKEEEEEEMKLHVYNHKD